MSLALPLPALVSLTGLILGGLSVFVISCLLQTITTFFNIVTFITLVSLAAATLFVVLNFLLPWMIILVSSRIDTNRYIDYRGCRNNMGIAFSLGVAGVFGCLLVLHALYDLANPRTVWPFGIYLFFLAFFHWSEFFFTALTNPARIDTDIYLLDHSPQYLAAATLSFVEYWLGVWLWSAKTNNYLPVNVIGLLICIAAESLRKVAILTAGANFSHYIEYTKRSEHRLVRNGVYSWCRHPAYAGWFFWCLGTQLLLVNPVCVVVYAWSAYAFFRHRVDTEERCLLVFFGDAYLSYQREVGTGLPFIRGYTQSD